VSEERRRAPRVDIVQHVAGRAVAMNAHVRILEMSPGGMLIETTAEMAPLGVHEFRLRLTGGEETLVRGHIVHGRFEVKYGGVKYVLGVRFSFVPVESAEVIRKYILEAKPAPFPEP
jgi:hypothetical protein